MAQPSIATPTADAGSRENVAYKLTTLIISKKLLEFNDKATILDLYAECLVAAQGGRDIKR